uniref:Carboxypeptidase n=1 Tax=Scolopendra viridis TaxID=118503 RepID=A0A4D5R9R6_SCOVI
MARYWFLVLSLLIIPTLLCGKKIKDGKETWGYENIRTDAFMFWWLYYSTSNASYLEQPLVLWLQGGPGASSTGYGNFMEIGPLTVNLTQRNTTWVQNANVLFVDNPVGTGFSYVTNKTALTHNNTEIANDLLTFLISFMKKIPEFQKVPLYIFSESYGGKMAVTFSKTLLKAIEAQKIRCNFAGVALGDSWISPEHSVLSWGPFLYSTSLIDESGLRAINDSAYNVKGAIDKKDFAKATELWNVAETVVQKYTNNVNFYNILTKDNSDVSKIPEFTQKHLGNLYRRHVLTFQDDELSKLMNGKIREKLHTIPPNVTWGGQSADVFAALSEDFMKPVTLTVEQLLNLTRLPVIVYNGQLDLIVDTLGTNAWIQNIKWLGLPSFMNATRSPIAIPGDDTAAFVKSFKNFAMYWILKAGHMVPADAGATGLKLLQMVTKNGNKP